MPDYVIMDDEQRAAAREASADILDVAKEHAPMAVFESLCTLIAHLSNSLDLPLSSSLNRIEDRYKWLCEAESRESN